MSWLALYYASEWVIRLGALIVLPPRLRPTAARAWLLLIFILPWPGVVLYMILGRRVLPQSRIELQKQLSDQVRAARARGEFAAVTEAPSLPPALESVPVLAQALGGFPVVGGNSWKLLPDYTAAHEALLADIAQAQQHVHLLTFIFANDATGRRFEEALYAATARGVRCRVLMDQIGTGRSARATVQRLRAGGVEAFLMLPSRFLGHQRSRLDLRNHRKIAVVDGRIGYVGSQNIVKAEVWRGHPNVELLARVTGPLVNQLQLLFLSDRLAEAGQPVEDVELFAAAERDGSSAAQMLPSGPAYRTANNLEVIVAALYGARARVTLVTPYFVPPDGLLEALCAAAQRRVEVHLIVPRWGNKLMEALAQHSYYEGLLEAGIHIHRFGPQFLHAKHISVDDDLAIIGSTNLDSRSFALDFEIVALICDRDVVRELRRVQDTYLASATSVEVESWQRRPWIQRVGEDVCRLLDVLL